MVGGTAAAALALGAVQWTHVLSPDELGACAVLPGAALERVAAVAAPPQPFEPEGARATGCSYGREPGVNLTVFSIGRGGGDVLREVRASGAAQGVAMKPLRGPGFTGYTSVGPRPGSESVVLVKHDQYVNVLVYNATPGTAERLGALAADTLA